MIFSWTHVEGLKLPPWNCCSATSKTLPRYCSEKWKEGFQLSDLSDLPTKSHRMLSINQLSNERELFFLLLILLCARGNTVSFCWTGCSRCCLSAFVPGIWFYLKTTFSFVGVHIQSGNSRLMDTTVILVCILIFYLWLQRIMCCIKNVSKIKNIID